MRRHPARRLHDALGRLLARIAVGLDRRGSVAVRDLPGGVRVLEGSWLVPPGAGAWTVGHTIVGRGPVRGRLLDHELVHVEQLDDDAWFGPRYLWESVRRGSYRRNRYEVAARERVARGDAARERVARGDAGPSLHSPT